MAERLVVRRTSNDIGTMLIELRISGGPVTARPAPPPPAAPFRRLVVFTSLMHART
jgi:hypothetical protein